MHVDQQVRYALVLQASLGTAIAALYGYVPGSDPSVWGAGIFGIFWLAFVEAVHRLRNTPFGKRLAAVDRGSRCLLMALPVAPGFIGQSWPMPEWLRWKLALFAGVIACGVAIRFALMSHFRTWAVMAREGPDDTTNAIIRTTYVRP